MTELTADLLEPGFRGFAEHLAQRRRDHHRLGERLLQPGLLTLSEALVEREEADHPSGTASFGIAVGRDLWHARRRLGPEHDKMPIINIDFKELCRKKYLAKDEAISAKRPFCAQCLFWRVTVDKGRSYLCHECRDR